jgi:hypothetical protein
MDRGRLISIAPSGATSQGEPYGYLIVAWSTNALDASISSIQLNMARWRWRCSRWWPPSCS